MQLAAEPLVAGGNEGEALRRSPDRREKRPDVPAIYVYLCSGKVDEISPASAVVLSQERLVVLWGETEVASYARRDVFFASKEPQSTPPC